MQASVERLVERRFHDLFGNARDLDVHLQSRDSARGSGHLEVHVAEVIFITEDVGQYRIAITFLDQTHGNARYRCLHRDPRVHQRKR